jgi:hypothetical protein
MKQIVALVQALLLANNQVGAMLWVTGFLTNVVRLVMIAAVH